MEGFASAQVLFVHLTQGKVDWITRTAPCDDGQRVVAGFGAKVNLRALGYTIQALVRIKPRSGQLHVVEKMIEEQPRFMSCDRVTGDDCYVTRLALADVAELDDILIPFHERAETRS